MFDAMASPVVPPQESPQQETTELQILLEIVKGLDRIESMLRDSKVTPAQASAVVPSVQSPFLDSLG